MAAKRGSSVDPKSFLAQAGEGRTVRKCRKNEIVFAQGDAADAVYFIQKGKVKITVVSEQGKEAVTAILGVHDFFGESCLTKHRRRLATATTLTETVLSRIEGAELIGLMHREAGFSELFVAYLVDRTIRAEADLVDQLFNSSEKRLARLLLLLANFGKEGPLEPVLAKISQQTLADMIGTTRARVSYFMNKFRKLGYIDYNGRIEVHTSLLNAVLHERPHIGE